ncbi:MAG: response regulator [Prolixibacteraceae bacterium]|nr:response regulator [Prolixibacteraceae bacterium]
MKRIKYSGIFLLILLVVNLNAQHLRFDRFDLSNGLSQNNVNCMEFDEAGNLWIGTLDGVNRYNGYQFDVFKPNRALQNNLVGNYVMSMGVGFKGDMWMITRGSGLNYFHAETQQFHLISPEYFESFNLENVNNIVQSNDSLLWMNSNSNLGLWEIGSNNFQTFYAKSAIKGIRKVNGNSVMIFGDFGIQKVNYNKINNTFQSKMITKQPCYGLFLEGNQWLFILSDGIYSIDKESKISDKLLDFKSTPFSNFYRNSIYDFAVINGTYWLGGDGFLVRFYEIEAEVKFQKFENDPQNDYSFKGRVVNRLRVDALGNLWIGTAKNGLLHLNRQKNQFQHYSWNIENMTDPESNPVRAICKTHNNSLWLGFDQEGIALWQANTKLKYYRFYFNKQDEKRAIENVRVIFEDSRGNIWIGVNDNLCIYNNQMDRFESVDCRFKWSWPYRCYVIKEFDPGRLTITSPFNIGLVNLEDESLSTIQLKVKGTNSLPTIRDIVQDKYRNLWLAQDNFGLLKITYPDMDYEFYQSENDGLTDDKVYCMLATGDSLWIGTNGGLNLFNLKSNKIEQNYFEEDGLSNNIVYSISKDTKGNLWMSTNRGISFFNPNTSVFKSYLRNDYFMDDAYFLDQQGTLFYGGYTGVVSFNPEQISASDEKIRPVFSELLLQNGKVFPGDTINHKVVLEKSLSETGHIAISYQRNSFSIGFNAYPFDYPNPNIFQYRLKGLHEDWILAKNDRLVTYNKVPPGEYVFELRVSRSNQNFSEPILLEIEVVPPFWKSQWFRFLALIFLSSLAFCIYRIRIKQIEQRNIWLQKKVDEQTSKLKEQNRQIKTISDQLHESDQSKLQFFTNISHEFRTPLTIILGQIESLKDESKQSVKSIRKNAQLLLQLINQVIDLRKLDQDKLNLHVSQIDVVDCIKGVVDTFKNLAASKQQQLHFRSELNSLLVWLDKAKIEMILYNLLSNAIKYSEEGDDIHVIIEKGEGCFIIEVLDNGIGISQKDQEFIFNRFYRTDSMKTVGHGIGLALVKGLVELHKGSIELESSLGKGSRFLLRFQLGKDHFETKDLAQQQGNVEYILSNENWVNLLIPELKEKRILLVEDNIDLLEFIANLLGKHFEVKTALHGRSALEILKTYSPDLIISDVMMPVMDGIEFCKVIKNSIETSHVPFIILSAKIDLETQLDGYDMGADAYIEKPFNIQLFIARINSLLINRENVKRQFEGIGHKQKIIEGLNGKDRMFIKSINTVIETNISNANFTIDILSEAMNMSRATFYRKFDELTGIKPADYVRKLRLKKAYGLVLDEALTINQIACEVGFQSVSHFRKSFKEEFGKTPSSIQKSK